MQLRFFLIIAYLWFQFCELRFMSYFNECVIGQGNLVLCLSHVGRNKHIWTYLLLIRFQYVVIIFGSKLEFLLLVPAYWTSLRFCYGRMLTKK